MTIHRGTKFLELFLQFCPEVSKQDYRNFRFEANRHFRNTVCAHEIEMLSLIASTLQSPPLELRN